MSFRGIKRLTADKHMSNVMRKKAKMICQLTGKDYTNKPQGLQLSHFIGRGNWAVRFDPKNCLVLSAWAHSEMESHPVKHINLWREIHGGIYGRSESDTELNALLARSTCAERDRYARDNHDRIAKHYLRISKELDTLTEEEIDEYEIHPPVYREGTPILD
jgi:hypothetical protein